MSMFFAPKNSKAEEKNDGMGNHWPINCKDNKLSPPDFQEGMIIFPKQKGQKQPHTT